MTDTKFSHGVTLQTSVDQRKPVMSMLLWGASGFGKTSLACTLPGKKLLVSFDPGGKDSITHRIGVDVDVLDFSAAPKEIVNDFKNADNPLNLKDIILNYDSLILDSITMVAEQATLYGISITKGAMLERASPGAYAARNALTLALINGVMRLCSKNDKHLACVAHEKDGERDENGILQSIVINLGGQLPGSAALRFSEVWPCYSLGQSGQRFIGLRNGVRKYTPAKSRMFDTRAVMEMPWKFDAVTWEGETIADFYDDWCAKGYTKILPSK